MPLMHVYNNNISHLSAVIVCIHGGSSLIIYEHHMYSKSTHFTGSICKVHCSGFILSLNTVYSTVCRQVRPGNSDSLLENYKTDYKSHNI